MNNRKDMGTKSSPYNTETRIIKANHFKIGSLLEAHNALQESMDLANPYKMKHGDTTSSNWFHGFIMEATQTAPVLLSCQETNDDVDNMAFACGHTKHLSKAILITVLPNGMLPSFDDDAAAN
eukprot:14557730-Ditylum_brightwellii.AAC.1